MYSKLLFLISFWCNVNAANILIVFPSPSVSHQVVAGIYAEELAKSGHNIVFITANPEIVDTEIKNITTVDVRQSYASLGKLYETWSSTAKYKVIKDIESALAHSVIIKYVSIVSEQFKIPQVRNILEDRKRKFDLIVSEAITGYPLILSHIFDAPVIQLSSFYGNHINFHTLGAIGIHPIYYPMTMRNTYGELTIWQKIYQIYLEFRIYKQCVDVEKEEDRLLKLNFGPNVPSVNELKENIVLLFTNTHPIFDNNRPVPPGVVYLGGLHLKPVKPLPKDLKTILDQSTKGVVYMSFGTNVDPSEMDVVYLNKFIIAVESLPYTVLWKFKGSIPQPPDNLITRDWFPQRDLLNHSKILAFVTQGGLQSTDEAVDSGVPLVGIPFLWDQWYNTHQYQRLGIGLALDPYTFTSDQLIEAIHTVINDESYRQNIKRLRSLINDQPLSARKRAVWWTEFVLRHGRPPLKAAAAQVTWSNYLMVDIGLLLLAVVVITLVVLYIVSVAIMRIFSYKRKIKQN